MVPDAYVTVRTVDSCVGRGLLRREGTGYDAPATLTERGRVLLALHDPETFVPLRVGGVA